MTTHSNDRSRSSAVEIKGGSVTLPIIRLLSGDMVAVATQLARRVEQAPEFFRSAPVVIEASALADQSSVDLESLLKQLRELGMIAVGLRGGDDVLKQSAAALDLALLADTATPEPREATPRPKVVATSAVAESEPPGRSLLIDQPVRSGQRVYAKGTDLIVLASVGNGAEIMADGHIHIYGTLRGRALAGVRGDTECRIFCHDLQAELVSIAGHYRVNEDLDDSVQRRSVQIYMRDTALIIEAL
ncbi:MAG: septum site-determining protein MinC [Methylohalobius sp. ZOD2]